MTEEQSTLAQQAIRSWRASGIPVYFHDPNISLGSYAAQPEHRLSARSKRVYELFCSNEAEQVLSRGMFFNDDCEDIFCLTARALTTKFSLPVILTDILQLDVPRNDELIMKCRNETKALFIRDFYIAYHPNAISESVRVRIEGNLRWIMSQGVALFLLADAPLAKCGWWSPFFLQLISERLSIAPYV